jgi:hypothetical protein
LKSFLFDLFTLRYVQTEAKYRPASVVLERDTTELHDELAAVSREDATLEGGDALSVLDAFEVLREHADVFGYAELDEVPTEQTTAVDVKERRARGVRVRNASLSQDPDARGEGLDDAFEPLVDTVMTRYLFTTLVLFEQFDELRAFGVIEGYRGES